MTEIKELLSDLDFPASKQQIVEHARSRGGPGTAADRAVAALPLGDYANLGEVLRSVPNDPGPPRTSPERAYQRRHHRKAGLSERARESELPPVTEELSREPGRERG